MRRAPRRWNTPLGRWVTGYGVMRLARDLSHRGQPVTAHAVYQWIAGVTTPRPDRAAVIVDLSSGAVGMADVYAQRVVLSGTIEWP